MKRIVDVRRRALATNDERAGLLRERFAAEGTLVVNLISSPGSGKTALLEATVRDLDPGLRCAVLEGDVATQRDAERIRAAGAPAHQILTGGACHLDARQIATGLDEAGFAGLDILFIENVGNLICPTSYDLGEDFKVALLSVVEGDDKPFKYPAIFSKAQVTVVTKIDLLPHVAFDLAAVDQQIHTLNPGADLIGTSTVTGEGLVAWCSLLTRRLHAKTASSG